MTKQSAPLDTHELRKFGLLMAGVFLLISGIMAWKGHWTAMRVMWFIAGVVFLCPALVWPKALGPVHRNWMKLAAVLGWVNQRIILSLVYYLLFTPISWIQRLIGRDPLERKFPIPNKTSYWHDRRGKEFNRKHFQRQF